MKYVQVNQTSEGRSVRGILRDRDGINMMDTIEKVKITPDNVRDHLENIPPTVTEILELKGEMTVSITTEKVRID